MVCSLDSHVFRVVEEMFIFAVLNDTTSWLILKILTMSHTHT